MADAVSVRGIRHEGSAPQGATPTQAGGDAGDGGRKPPERSLTASWRQTALRRYDRLRFDLICVDPCELDARRLDELAAVTTLVDEAGWRAEQVHVHPFTWWSGAEVERVWRMLREAEERRVDLVHPAELDALAADAVRHAKTAGVSDGDANLLDLEARRALAAERRRDGRTPSDAATTAYRAAIRAVLGVAHARSDWSNQEARAHRNRLLLASVFSTLAAVALVVLQWRLPTTALLIPAPAGWASSSWALMVAIMVFGSAGALFTAIPVLAKVPSDASPFNLPLQQAILKVTFGMLTAVFGVAAFGAVEVNGLDVVVSDMATPTLLVLAVAFGSAQQTVTRYFDRRAAELLAPAKEATPPS